MHRFGGGDIYGVTYTCRGGFFDFGHARDTLDLTRYHHHQLTLGGNNVAGRPYRAITPGATVRISSVVPAGDVLETAASIAYDESVWHEIETWFYMSGGRHNSSFSPEDLTSNFLGTWIARGAIATLAAGGDFDTAATTAMSTLLRQLDARPPRDTNAAFAAVTGRWIAPSSSYANGGMNLRYLLRRNFDVNPIVPWKAPGVAFCTSTTWPVGVVPTGFSATILGRYDVEFIVPREASVLGSTVRRTTFAAAIAKIEAEAVRPGPAPPAGPPGGIPRGYGPDFKTP
ncbi:MAG: DUF4056 domain-containing protein [Actinobacteria bacterium]|nr:DUF4056 domain-containing protein [Actinomycetota bacterium]